MTGHPLIVVGEDDLGVDAFTVYQAVNFDNLPPSLDTFYSYYSTVIMAEDPERFSQVLSEQLQWLKKGVVMPLQLDEPFLIRNREPNSEQEVFHHLFRMGYCFKHGKLYNNPVLGVW